MSRNNVVLYPDAQAANLFDGWQNVKGIWFMPTH
jgi:hypothetical protein